LVPANSGTVKLFGKPFTSNDRALKRLVGLGTQDLSIYPELTARENLRFFGKLYGLYAKQLNARVDEVLAAVELTDRANDRVSTFSGGMKRRLNLGAAIVHAPKLLFLDEPTTGVDPQSRNHIFERVKALNAAGMTIIYTSHYMEEVQTLCRRIAILDGGKVRACDTLPNLLKRLDATIRVTLTNAPPDFAERLAALPDVKRVRPTEGGFELVVHDIGPALAKVASTCAETGATLTTATTGEPTLERVFLQMTGRALRD
jgi:ABC-2 type transport system ATP-binding protein